MKTFKIILMVCLLSAWFSCQKEAMDEEQLTESANKALKPAMEAERPYYSFYITESEILQPPPMLKTRITGYGEGSHTGKSQLIVNSTADLTGTPPFPVNGTATFTAANGDEFYTTFTGTLTPQGQGVNEIRTQHTVTGGTGRFADAKGQFTGSSTAVPGQSGGTNSNRGWLSY